MGTKFYCSIPTDDFSKSEIVYATEQTLKKRLKTRYPNALEIKRMKKHPWDNTPYIEVVQVHDGWTGEHRGSLFRLGTKICDAPGCNRGFDDAHKRGCAHCGGWGVL